MKRYFITYGNKLYENSKKRLAKQAAETGFFDNIITYGQEDVSPEVTNSPLFKYEKGGGYWLWKPDIVSKTLNIMDEGDILVYADSGCSVFKSDEWNRYFDLLKKYNGIVFLINSTNEQYTRRNVIEHFSEIGKNWQKRYQVASGFFILKKNNATVEFIKKWQDIMLNKPEFVMDVSEEEMSREAPNFIANRHDQSILTALSYKYEEEYNLKILFNRFEGGVDRFRKQALIATRISDRGVRGMNRSFLKNLLLYLLAKPYRFLYQQYWLFRG